MFDVLKAQFVSCISLSYILIAVMCKEQDCAHIWLDVDCLVRKCITIVLLLSECHVIARFFYICSVL